MIDGPTPLHLIESTEPGTGKTLLVQVLTIPGLGGPVTCTAVGDDGDEVRRGIYSELLKLPGAVLLDNLGRIGWPTLANALTARRISDRVVGRSVAVDVPVRCLWLATANNPSLTTEIARRTVTVRLEPPAKQPIERAPFRLGLTQLA